MTPIELSDDEQELLTDYANKQGISLNEACQQVFTHGLNDLLTELAPSTMALKRILRDSKRTGL